MATLPESQLTTDAKRLMKSGWGDDPTDDDPEWLIFFGNTRTSKSYSSLNMAEWAVIRALEQNLEGDDLPMIYILNLDKSTKRDLENFPLLTDLGRVRYMFCDSIEKLMVATCVLVGDPRNKIPKLVRPNLDWIIVDRATVVWEMMPDYWCRTRLGRTADEVEFDYQKSYGEDKIKSGSGMLQYYANGINPLWYNWETTIRMSGAHCIFICTEQELALESTKVRNKDDAEKIATFSSVGFVPRMQGNTWSRWHTQLYFSRPFTKKEFFVRTVGDRGSRMWLGAAGERCRLGEGMEGLGEIYLGGVAGWNKNA